VTPPLRTSPPGSGGRHRATTVEPVIVGVAGGSGSGKTTVVREILERLRPERVGVIHHDAYYRSFGHLPEDTRAQINFDHPDALETELLVSHLTELMIGRGVDLPIYDFTSHTRSPETLRLEPTEVLIVDGILVLAEPELRRRMDIKIFVDTDADIRFIRRLTRDINDRGRSLDSVVTQYQEWVRPMHLEFVEPSKRYAHVIIPEGGENRVAIDMVVAKLASVLEERTELPAR
jgi:uridine kinase